MTFNDAAVDTVFDRVVSYAMETGRFDVVNQHEPTSAPHHGLQCSIWIQQIRPVISSGLAATSGIVQLNARCYMNFRSHPHDLIDPHITAAIVDLMAVLSGDFDFGGEVDVRHIDLLGAYGQPLAAQAGYLELDRQYFRVMTLTIPVVINDMFIQESGSLCQ